ncbi:hypothetical protein NDU88_008656 [Pleurodeles waltl]|uniref:Uncharacterized protein n=1 Tax=Pleurodeles waltl TaxID=8319 RepID=A0AAV7NEV2_PLEWA|nr:hypothetical protein NDU88_008656 [Pleurodeles waltl]
MLRKAQGTILAKWSPGLLRRVLQDQVFEHQVALQGEREVERLNGLQPLVAHGDPDGEAAEVLQGARLAGESLDPGNEGRLRSQPLGRQSSFLEKKEKSPV